MSLDEHVHTLLAGREPASVDLPRVDPATDPVRLFAVWYREATAAAGAALPEAAALATADAAGRPSVRVVLLKGLEEDGFLFYTNYGSRKAADMDENPRAALCFHWGALERQVRVEGEVARTSRETSAAYFATRPRESQIGAWASEQSRPLDDRGELEARVQELEARFAGEPVPLPDDWGGYRLRPLRIEFWQGAPGRLHHRLAFLRGKGGDWTTHRLQP